jgi:hypothetical protein
LFWLFGKNWKLKKLQFQVLNFSRIRECQVRRSPWEPEDYSLEGGKLSSLHPWATTLKLGEAIRGKAFSSVKQEMFFNSSDEGIFSARRCIQIQREKKPWSAA